MDGRTCSTEILVQDGHRTLTVAADARARDIARSRAPRALACGVLSMAMMGACDAKTPREGHAQAPPPLQCAMVAAEHDTTCVLFAPSLIELIARPELYDGKRVLVTGFANLEFEGNSLYVSREDYVQMIERNGLWLEVGDLLRQRFARQLPGYFLVEGEFSSRDRGHLGMSSGSIRNVSRFEPNLSRADIERMQRRSAREGAPRR